MHRHPRSRPPFTPSSIQLAPFHMMTQKMIWRQTALLQLPLPLTQLLLVQPLPLLPPPLLPPLLPPCTTRLRLTTRPALPRVRSVLRNSTPRPRASMRVSRCRAPTSSMPSVCLLSRARTARATAAAPYAERGLRAAPMPTLATIPQLTTNIQERLWSLPSPSHLFRLQPSLHTPLNSPPPALASRRTASDSADLLAVGVGDRNSHAPSPAPAIAAHQHHHLEATRRKVKPRVLHSG